MTITKFKGFLTCTVAVAAVLMATQAEAGWRHGGSCGSSGGSWGSSGGSWGSSGGSWGSSGGSWGSSGGSSGGYYYGSWGGSSGGSWGSSGGSWGSSGGYVHYGSWGSSGGSWGSSGGHVLYDDAAPDQGPAAPRDNQPNKMPAPGNARPAEPVPDAADGTTYFLPSQGRNAVLTVRVPADAKVTVNGRTTNSTGIERRYISRGLEPGAHYTYEVQAEILRDGKPVVESKSIQLTAGRGADLAFTFPAAGIEQASADSQLRTTLVVKVPAEAKVTLAGRESNSTGSVRQFTTTKLAAGGEWNNYVVRAEIERDGHTLTKEQTVSLKAGDSRELSFNFDSDGGSDRLADRTR